MQRSALPGIEPIVSMPVTSTAAVPPPRRAWAWLAIALLAATWLAMLLLGAGPVDQSILLTLYAGSRPGVVAIARGFTLVGEWPVVVAASLVAAGLLVHRGKRRLAVMLMIGTLAARLLVAVQKVELGRIRPDEHLRLVHVSTLSFPSGHSANSMLVYPLCALLLAPKPWRRAAAGGAIMLSLCIGASRVLLGVHWPSDVVAGWSFGLLWLLVLLQLAWRNGRLNQNGG